MEDLRQKAQDRINYLLENKAYKRKEIAEKIGISYLTYYNRYKTMSWTKPEAQAILNDL